MKGPPKPIRPEVSKSQPVWPGGWGTTTLASTCVVLPATHDQRLYLAQCKHPFIVGHFGVCVIRKEHAAPDTGDYLSIWPGGGLTDSCLRVHARCSAVSLG